LPASPEIHGAELRHCELGGIRVAEVAMGECGSFEHSHMERLVKRWTGQSPGDIRRSAQRAGRRQGG